MYLDRFDCSEEDYSLGSKDFQHIAISPGGILGDTESQLQVTKLTNFHYRLYHTRPRNSQDLGFTTGVS